MSAIVEAAEQYSDQLWRLNNLYWIIDKDGNKVRFTPNESQLSLYHEMWYRNVILKARQRGYTTFIDIFALDSCVFNNDFSAGIIAHNLEDAKKIFRTKVKHPYDHLPEGIKSLVTASNDRVGEYVFSNGSSISVSTSYRSGTLQILHVSEFGKIAAKSPEKAREIRTGAFEAVPKDGIILVESTAEGQGGDFYDMTKRSQAIKDAHKDLSKFDFKFIFDPWWKNPDYILDKEVLITTEDAKYFKRLRDDYGIVLNNEQKWWYVAKKEDLQDDMTREYPSYPDEAFESAIRGGIYTSQMARARKDGRICRIPIESGIPVHTFWDLGKRDATAIWFMQEVGKEIRWIDYEESSGQEIEDYCKLIKEKGYSYGKHYMPHDVTVALLGMKKSRKRQFEEGGVTPIQEVDRIPVLIEGVQMVRKTFASYWFDEERCSQGIKNLDNYQWKWNESIAAYTHDHLHNWASNGADAIRQQAQAYESESKTQARPLNFKKAW